MKKMLITAYCAKKWVKKAEEFTGNRYRLPKKGELLVIRGDKYPKFVIGNEDNRKFWLFSFELKKVLK